MGPAVADVSTRERILDVALDLFVDQGYDGTSLREIAERLGVTKAALYYHFESKDDILMALHLRLHGIGIEGLAKLAEGPVTLAKWEALLDDVLRQVIAQRKLFLLHERNQAAMEKLHRDEAHEAAHDDLLVRLRGVFTDPVLPIRDRVKMACSIGAVFSVLTLTGEAFDATSPEELGSYVRGAIHGLLFS